MAQFTKLKLNNDDTCMIELPDGSNLTLSFRKGEPNQVEVNAYTSSEKGCIRKTPAIHLINSNTLAIEFRKINK